jgi:hypothetical protein
MGHFRAESKLAATISAEEVEKMFRNGVLLGRLDGEARHGAAGRGNLW